MEALSMSVKERRRLEIFGRVKANELTLSKGAELLGLSYRQAKRVWARYRDRGDSSLVHGLRGRASNRRDLGGRKERALELYRKKYLGYGPTLAAECLGRDDGLVVAVSTLRAWLSSAGLWQRQRRRKLHRRRRPRRERYGELVQLDGSHHDWFAGRRGWAVLMVMIDDATGRVFARLFENESWDSAAVTLRRYTQLHGLPCALYVDQHSIYRADRDPTSEELVAGLEPQTQFGRAMHELDVELILARSPQAKGRVERVNRTLQDRLVKSLTRAGLSDLGSANRYLEETYLPQFNEQFGKPPTKASDLHRVVPDEHVLRVLSLQEIRVVQPDWTVRWQNGFLQLPRATVEQVQPGDKVVVSVQLDGQLRLFAGEQELAWSLVRDTAPPVRVPSRPRGPTGSSQGHKPAANHPWRRSILRPAPNPPAAPVGLDCFATVAAFPPLRSPTPQQTVG